MKKVIALLLVLLLSLTAINFALADGDEGAEAPAHVAEEKKEEKAEEKKEEKAEEKTEAPAEEKAEEKTEAPAEEEKSEEKSEEVTEEAGEIVSEETGEIASDKTEETEEKKTETEETEKETEKTEETEAAAEETEEAVEEPAVIEERSVSVKLEIKNKGEICLGDKVTIKAKVKGLECAYGIAWECNKGDGKGWKEISGATSDSYSFTLDEENAAYSYRAIVTVG